MRCRYRLCLARLTFIKQCFCSTSLRATIWVISMIILHNKLRLMMRSLNLSVVYEGESDMTKTLVALGTAAAIGAAALTTSTAASAQPWVAPVVAGSVIAGGMVGAAIASSPHYYYPAYYRPRGLFTYGYNDCGCVHYYCPEPGVYAPPAYDQPYAHRYYGQPHYGGYARPYRYRYASHYRYHRPHVRPYYHAGHRRW